MKKYLICICTLLVLVFYANSCSRCTGAQCNPELDTDGDGLTDLMEEQDYGTDPMNPDSDEDGLMDGAEVNDYQTDPLAADSDEDGLPDGEEVNSYQTDPKMADTDGDQLNDGAEVNEYFSNPLDEDSDDDNLNDYVEVMELQTNPNNYDTDGDGFADGVEVNEIFSDPLDPRDPPYIAELANIYFDFDHSHVDSLAESAVYENVEKLNAAPSVALKVVGYTDHVGNDWYNLRLSRRRAYAVYQAYQEWGVSEDRMDFEGSGKAPVPCGYEDYEGQGCRDNRRTESQPIHSFSVQPNGN